MSFIVGSTGGDGVIRRKLAALLNEERREGEGGSATAAAAEGRGRSVATVDDERKKESSGAAAAGGPVSLIDLSSIIGERVSPQTKGIEKRGRPGLHLCQVSIMFEPKLA